MNQQIQAFLFNLRHLLKDIVQTGSVSPIFCASLSILKRFLIISMPFCIYHPTIGGVMREI